MKVNISLCKYFFVYRKCNKIAIKHMYISINFGEQQHLVALTVTRYWPWVIITVGGILATNGAIITLLCGYTSL